MYLLLIINMHMLLQLEECTKPLNLVSNQDALKMFNMFGLAESAGRCRFMQFSLLERIARHCCTEETK